MASTRIHICLSVTHDTDREIDALSARRGVCRSAVIAQIVAEEIARVKPPMATPTPAPMFVD